MGQLDGKVALITGGSAGIGLETARSFAAEGAQVYLTGRRTEVVDAAVADMKSDTGADVIGVVGNVSDLASLDAIYATITERSGQLDVLVANAGSGRPISLTEITEDHYDTTFDDNVKGLVFTVQKALPLLPTCVGGLMSSIAGISGQPGMSVYAATKAAIRNFARSWALELAPRSIRVSALCPGPVSTPGMSNVLAELGDEGAASITTPFGRLGDAKEIAAGAVFLASDQSSFLTGSDLIIDGGANI